MTNAKVTVPKDVAKTIEALREYGYSNARIVYEMEKGGLLQEPLGSYFNESPRTTDYLLSALINGYEVEKSPEEKLREYYANLRKSRTGSICDYQSDAVVETLNLLGIKVGGINA